MNARVKEEEKERERKKFFSCCVSDLKIVERGFQPQG
jgi:hypothetical protein